MKCPLEIEQFHINPEKQQKGSWEIETNNSKLVKKIVNLIPNITVLYNLRVSCFRKAARLLNEKLTRQSKINKCDAKYQCILHSFWHTLRQTEITNLNETNIASTFQTKSFTGNKEILYMMLKIHVIRGFQTSDQF